MYMLLHLILAFLLTVSASYAQDAAVKSGSVQGIVVDAENGEAMIGVSVMLEGTQQGAATDLDGNFTIRNVAPGNYNVIANYVGYAKLSVTDVIVRPGEGTTINMKMATEAIEVKEVVIQARKMDNTETSILQMQRRSATVSNGISAEQIKRSTDSDAADAVKRVTGISVIGDKYVYVRGMGERYNNTRLNGASLSSPEPLKRTVPFDIIPANLLNNIIVSKTFTPDQPGDFSGGSVQLSTKDFPDKLTFSLSQSVDYNENSTFKEFQTYKGGDFDWVGYDDGARAIPDGVVSGIEENPEWANDVETSRAFAKQFSNVWEGRTVSAPLNGSRSIAFGNQALLFGRPFGFLGTVTQATSFSSRNEQEFTFVSNSVDGQVNLEREDSIAVQKFTRTGSIGGIVDLNYKPSSLHKFSLKSLYTRSGDDEVKNFVGLLEDNLLKGTRLTWTERSLATLQPKGEHQLTNLRNSRLEWALTYSRGTFDQPDRRDVYYRMEPDGQFRFLPSTSSGFRRYAKMRDNSYEGSLDWTMPIKGKDGQSKIKFGGMFKTMDREFPTRKFNMRNVDEIGADPLDYGAPAEVLYSPDNIDEHWIIREITTNLDSYEAEMQTGAGYLMTDLLLSKKWRAVFGARVESTDQYFKTFPYPGSPSTDFAEGGPSHTDLMPSLNLTYLFNDKTNFRFAISKTVANPDYAELVPTVDSDYYEGTEKIGNPNVDYTKIVNVDLRAELYPTIGENLSVGLFYKRINDPIEWIYTQGSATGGIYASYPDNLVDASNLGAELEFRKSLDFASEKLGAWMRFFSVQGNLTVVSSEVDLNQPAYDPANLESGLLTSTERPLMGQSDYVVNATLAFDQPLWGTNMRLLFNTFGKRISQVGGYGIPDTYEQPFDRIDFAVSQSLGGNWNAKVQAKNLLDSKVEFLTGGQVQNTYKLGQSYSFGISYSI